MSRSPKKIKKYLARAYLVYFGQRNYQVIAKINTEVARKANYLSHTDIIIRKQTINHFFKHFFDKNTQSINKQELFVFIKVLNFPDEIFLSQENKLRYFKTQQQLVEYEVIVAKDKYLLNKSNVLTCFSNDLSNKRDRNYSLRQKKHPARMLFILEGRRHIPHLTCSRKCLVLGRDFPGLQNYH